MYDAALVVFTKSAIPGRVKTRLIGHLSPQQAADLHAAFVGDLLERMAGGPFAVELAWALLDGEALPVLDWPVSAQRGPNLGARLFHGLEEAARRYPLVAAVGSDHPELPLAYVSEAFDALRSGSDVAIGPAEDGGYYLLAARRDRLDPKLFEGVEWSTERVLGQTLERCRDLGLTVHRLPTGTDVDRPADLARLAGRLAQGAARCPRTADLMTAWGLGAAP